MFMVIFRSRSFCHLWFSGDLFLFWWNSGGRPQKGSELGLQSLANFCFEFLEVPYILISTKQSINICLTVFLSRLSSDFCSQQHNVNGIE